MRCVIFDLDGTLLDTSPGIIESVKYAAYKLGYPELSEAQLHTFIGPPIKVSYTNVYRCSSDEAERLTAAFREHYSERAILNARPYDGIIDLCNELKNKGIPVKVATNKPQPYAEQVLNHFGFDRYISDIRGARMDGGLTKSDLIKLCVADNELSECVMIGDTEHDAKGAQEAGVPFIGVTYGFGDPDMMAKYPSVGIADSPSEIMKILIEREQMI